MRGTAVLLPVLLLILSVPRAEALSASSYVLMEASSGRILEEHDAHQPRMIASITKLMTALTALESGHSPDEEIRIREEWTGAEGSSIYLQPGETITLESLLYGMMLRSGNDAALAVAGACADSEEAFVQHMNRKAQDLGMQNTHFQNPSGLNENGHYSTARDMAVLARACLQNETLAKIVSSKTAAFGGRSYTNHNKLLWRYPGCIGLKTGYTELAGRTLVSAAERDGVRLICVTLNDPDDWADHAALLDSGFRRCTSRTMLKRGEEICRIPVSGSLFSFCPLAAACDLSLTLQAGEVPKANLALDQAALTAPVRAGDKLGACIYTLGDVELGRVDLAAAQDIPCSLAPQVSPFQRLLAALGLISDT